MSAWLRRILPYTWPIRVALGVLFLYSSTAKIGDLNAVVANVRQYHLLPEPLPIPFGYALPFGELAIGLLLLFGLFTQIAAAGGLLLMLAFLIAIAFSLIRGGAQPDCGCFSLSGGDEISWLTFGRDLLFVVGLVFPLLDRAHLVSVDRFYLGWGAPDEAAAKDLEEDQEIAETGSESPSPKQARPSS